jgi:hypothetical protein
VDGAARAADNTQMALQLSETVRSLPALEIAPPELQVELESANEGTLGRPQHLSLLVHNEGTVSRSLRLAFLQNAFFVFSGHKAVSIELPPKFSRRLTFTLVPIKSGEAVLPAVRLWCTQSEEPLLDTSARHIIFIRPAGVNALNALDIT